MGLFNIIPFFGREQEKNTIELIKKHADKVLETVERLPQVFDALDKKDAKRLNEEIEKVRVLEHEADVIRRQVEETMYSGAFMPISRGRIFDFCERLDTVANSAQDFANMTDYLVGIRINEEIRGMMTEIVDTTLSCTRALTEAVHSMDDAEKLKALIQKVRDEEHKIDIIQVKLYHTIYRRGAYGPTDILVLTKTADFLGTISNDAEDASDALNLIILMHKP
ncbi:Uncharacterised protein [uncultured archaeon]|nr:Uncharacterised protein [uncultured archaeon]